MKEDLLLDNINKLKEYKMNDKSLEYIYKNKNGLYKDFVNLFGAKEFERCQYSNLIKPCVRSIKQPTAEAMGFFYTNRV